MSTTKTHWKKLTNPDYLGAYAFSPNEEKTVTIDFVQIESVMGSNGRKEDCSVMHFRDGTKPLILNVTNSKTITKVLQTPYIEEWAGKRIVLGVDMVNAFGELTEAVRVRNKRPAPPKETACVECGQIITGHGNFSAEQIIRASTNKFGEELCFDCAESRKNADKGEAEV